jgi:hypothetical protein
VTSAESVAGAEAAASGIGGTGGGTAGITTKDDRLERDMLTDTADRWLRRGGLQSGAVVYGGGCSGGGSDRKGRSVGGLGFFGVTVTVQGVDEDFDAVLLFRCTWPVGRADNDNLPRFSVESRWSILE